MSRIILCAALMPVVEIADAATPSDDSLPTLQKTDGLWQPILPPTSGDGADALDRQVYSEFSNDDIRLANEAASSKPYSILPHGSLTSFYDDNISLNSTNQQGALGLALEPGVALGLGDFKSAQTCFVVADYTGRWTSYLNHSAADAYEQFASVRAQLALAKWKFNTNFRFVNLDDVDIDSGARTWRLIYDTVQVASYEISAKDFLELQGQNIIRDYQTGPDSVEWQARGLYNYRFDPKLTFGGGFAGGVLNLHDYAGQTYEQTLLRALYDIKEKVSIQVQGGLELRSLPSGVDKFTPVMDLIGVYRPQPGTQFELTGYVRTFSSSSSGNVDFTATGVSLSVAREFGFSWLATLKGGYENNSYFYTDNRAASPRDDTFFYINPVIQFRLTEHTKIEMFYNYRRNESDISGYVFTDNQTGIRVSVSY